MNEWGTAELLVIYIFAWVVGSALGTLIAWAWDRWGW